MLRVRPKAMTVAVIMAGLLPIMLGDGHRRRGHAADRGADGRRDDHRAAPVDAGASGGVPAAAPPAAAAVAPRPPPVRRRPPRRRFPPGRRIDRERNAERAGTPEGRYHAPLSSSARPSHDRPVAHRRPGRRLPGAPRPRRGRRHRLGRGRALRAHAVPACRQVRRALRQARQGRPRAVDVHRRPARSTSTSTTTSARTSSIPHGATMRRRSRASWSLRWTRTTAGCGPGSPGRPRRRR